MFKPVPEGYKRNESFSWIHGEYAVTEFSSGRSPWVELLPRTHRGMWLSLLAEGAAIMACVPSLRHGTYTKRAWNFDEKDLVERAEKWAAKGVFPDATLAALEVLDPGGSEGLFQPLDRNS